MPGVDRGTTACFQDLGFAEVATRPSPERRWHGHEQYSQGSPLDRTRNDPSRKIPTRSKLLKRHVCTAVDDS